MALDQQIDFKRDIVLLTLLFATVALMGCGQTRLEQKTHKIGILSGFAAFADIAEGFKDKMTELGYIEGQDIVYDLQNVNTDDAALQRAIKRFKENEVDLILSFPTEASIRAKDLTRATTIPLVFALAGIEGNNLVDSVHHPGGNISGVRFPGPDLTVKRFELLLELAPHIKKVWTAYDINYPTNGAAIKVLRQAASASRVTLVEKLVTNTDEIQADLQARAASGDPGIDAILIMPDTVSQSPAGWTAIAAFAAEHKLPIVGTGGGVYDAHTVISYTPDKFEIGRQAALIADKIIKGTPAGKIMVVTPQCRLRLNYTLAQELGLTVPEGLLSKADEILR
ncbi:MAG: ABC transporter substrate-binding protein [Desulfobacterales bacterium]|nr:MAG: ABC transporter substrate-binding protein [Desulfobacterales bacterium]